MKTYTIRKSRGNVTETIAEYYDLDDVRKHMIGILHSVASDDERVFVDNEDIANEIEMLQSVDADADMIARVEALKNSLPCITNEAYTEAATVAETEDCISIFYDSWTYICEK